MIEHAAQDAIDEYAPAEDNPEHWDLAGLRRRLILDFFLMVAELPEENEAEHEIERHEVVMGVDVERRAEAMNDDRIGRLIAGFVSSR